MWSVCRWVWLVTYVDGTKFEGVYDDDKKATGTWAHSFACGTAKGSLLMQGMERVGITTTPDGRMVQERFVDGNVVESRVLRGPTAVAASSEPTSPSTPIQRYRGFVCVWRLISLIFTWVPRGSQL